VSLRRGFSRFRVLRSPCSRGASHPPPRGLPVSRAGFTAAPSIDAELQRGSGHCIDFHLPSDEFQRSQLQFALATTERAAV